MKLRFVSSFNSQGYELYGRRFVESFLLNMPDESELLVYTESDPGPWTLPSDSRLKLLNLKELPSFETLFTIYNSLQIFHSDYRYSVGRFLPKVWALIGGSVEYDGILAWVDADTEWTGPLAPAFIEACLNHHDIAVMGRNRWHLCSSFLIIDCLTQGAQTFIKTLADMYGQGSVLLLAEWHDAFVVQSITAGMQARGELNVSNITDLLKLPCPSGPHNIFDDVFKGIARHFKGTLKQFHVEQPPGPEVSAPIPARLKGPARYDQLVELARSLKPRTFLEFGTWTGDRAIDVARASPGLDYVGIDLFETGTPEGDERELNVKTRIKAEQATKHLADHSPNIRNAVLYVGDSTSLDPEFVEQYKGWAELVFVDGGHSLATIESDLKHALLFQKPGGVIVMDDYYTDTEGGFTDKWGCNKILDTMGVDFEVLPLRDPIIQGGYVQMVIVRGEPAANNAHYSYSYIVAQKAMHLAYPTYGRTAKKWGARACTLIERYQPETILDYGCGKGELREQLTTAFRREQVREYDPGMPGKQAPPEPVDLVFCIDVLEHIEPEYLNNVLAHIRSLTKRTAFFTIATREAKKTLPDGRNSHLILKSAKEWESLLGGYFYVIEVEEDVTETGEVVILCEP